MAPVPGHCTGRLYLRSWRGDLIALDVSGDDDVTPHKLKPTATATGPRNAECLRRLDKLTPAPFQAPAAVDWRQWRGPQRDGVVAETGLKLNWPPVRRKRSGAWT